MWLPSCKTKHPKIEHSIRWDFWRSGCCLAKIRELINIIYQAKHTEEPAADFVTERGNKFERISLLEIIIFYWWWWLNLSTSSMNISDFCRKYFISNQSRDFSALSPFFFSPFPIYTWCGKRNKKIGYAGKCPSMHINSLY